MGVPSCRRVLVDQRTMSIRSLTTPKSVDDLLSHRSLYPPIAVCLNPGCTNSCSYPIKNKGRRPLFCSKSCATTYSANRVALLRELEFIETALSEVSTWSSAATELRQQRTHASWHLTRYGGEPNQPADAQSEAVVR